MFQESLVESSSLLRGHNRWAAIASFAIQAAIVSTLLALPLLHPEMLPLSTPKLSLVAPPPAPKPPPPPVQPVRVETSSTASTVAAPMQPARIPTDAFRSNGPPVDRPALAVGVNLIGVGQNPLTALSSLGTTGAHVVVGPAGNPDASPLNVSTGVMAGRLLEPIRPEYPAIARLSRSEGTVVVQAMISKTGKIESAHVMSGPAILQGAALEAVRNARYRPFLLNNQPTEVETTISIVFRLGS